MNSQSPNLETLIEYQLVLIKNISEAESLFGSDGIELITLKTGLKCIEELIQELGQSLPEQELSDKAPKVVMIADSDPHVADLVGTFLPEAGYTVTFETDGCEALSKARQTPPMVILADGLLPRLDGIALCRSIKGDPQTGHIVAVIVFSVLALEERAIKAGADAFIHKPLEKTRLLLMIEEAIKKRNAAA